MNGSKVSIPLAIDKSFARSVKAEHLAILSERHMLLVPSAFYYEVFTASDRRPTIAGLMKFQRVHLPILLRAETESGKPVRDIERRNLGFNSDVLSPDWVLTVEQEAIIRKYEQNTLEPGLALWDSVIADGPFGLSKNELEGVRGTNEQFQRLCETLRDRDRIRKFGADAKFRHASILDETWIHYRQFQAWLLQAFVLWRRYPDSKGGHSRNRTQLEHDFHDLDYLILGLHAGCLATKEISQHFSKFPMSWRFRILEPRGELVTPRCVYTYL